MHSQIEDDAAILGLVRELDQAGGLALNAKQAESLCVASAIRRGYNSVEAANLAYCTMQTMLGGGSQCLSS